MLALLEVREYNPQSSKRHRSPMALVDGRLLLCHEHLAGSWLELMVIVHIPSPPMASFMACQQLAMGLR